MDNMKLLKAWESKLKELGYKPAFYEEDGQIIDQLDCVIDGVYFSIGPDSDEDALWLSVIFEPNEELSDEEMGKLDSMVENGDGVFDSIEFVFDGTVQVLTMKDTKDVPAEYASQVVESINNPKGAIQYLKSISYVW